MFSWRARCPSFRLPVGPACAGALSDTPGILLGMGDPIYDGTAPAAGGEYVSGPGKPAETECAWGYRCGFCEEVVTVEMLTAHVAEHRKAPDWPGTVGMTRVDYAPVKP